MKEIVQPLKGTRDFYPEEKAKHNQLYDLIRKVSDSFGYQDSKDHSWKRLACMLPNQVKSWSTNKVLSSLIGVVK